jgi:hypothetical protein
MHVACGKKYNGYAATFATTGLNARTTTIPQMKNIGQR